MSRPLLVLCETCQSEGRILTSNGGPYDTDHGECQDCKGTGYALVECEPITMDDLALTDDLQKPLDWIASEPPKGHYGEWCRDPKLCAGKGYCPRDPNCAD